MCSEKKQNVLYNDQTVMSLGKEIKCGVVVVRHA